MSLTLLKSLPAYDVVGAQIIGVKVLQLPENLE